MTNLIKNIRYAYIAQEDFGKEQLDKECGWTDAKGLHIKLRSTALLLCDIKLKGNFRMEVHKPYSKKNYKGYTIFTFGTPHKEPILFLPLRARDYLVTITEYVETIKIEEKVMI